MGIRFETNFTRNKEAKIKVVLPSPIPLLKEILYKVDT